MTKVWKYDIEIGWYQVEEIKVNWKLKSFRKTKIEDLKYFLGNKE